MSHNRIDDAIPSQSREGAERQRLRNTLKQALSRNKALERQALWKQKNEEDHGSAHNLCLKTNKGDVLNLPVLPQSADVTRNGVNKYEEDRLRVASQKEDKLLDRLCDGEDHAWRPDSFFSEELGEDDVPWPVRPMDFFTNSTYVEKIVSAYEASRKLNKEKKKTKKKDKDKKQKKDKKHKNDKKSKKCKKGKKDKSECPESKERKHKKKASKKDKKRRKVSKDSKLKQESKIKRPKFDDERSSQHSNEGSGDAESEQSNQEVQTSSESEEQEPVQLSTAQVVAQPTNSTSGSSSTSAPDDD